MSSFLNTWLAHMELAGPEVPAAGDMGVLIVDDENPDVPVRRTGAATRRLPAGAGIERVEDPSEGRCRCPVSICS